LTGGNFSETFVYKPHTGRKEGRKEECQQTKGTIQPLIRSLQIDAITLRYINYIYVSIYIYIAWGAVAA